MIYTGVDEVGYGALAGPIVAAAVTMRVRLPMSKLHRFWPLATVKDSKKTTPAQRTVLSRQLTEFLILMEAGVGLGWSDAEEINRVGYASAANKARKRAVHQATLADGIFPDLVIVDGDVPLKPLRFKQACIPRADGKYWLVAAASILAKIYRDNLMVRASKKYPDYAWENNKGYTGGSAKSSTHVQGLARCGLSPLHRTLPCQTVLKKHHAP